MLVGIVGVEQAKFDLRTEQLARELIRELIAPEDIIVVSGHCHLGGVDIFAEEEAEKLGRQTIIYPPKNLSWTTGYKPRNLKIAKSDIVHCITVAKLPPTYTGMRFSSCYHCNTTKHIKSGGCWTARRCKAFEIHVLGQEVKF